MIQEISSAKEKVVRQQSKAATIAEGDGLAATSKMTALSDLEFKQTLPVIKDTDLNLDNHLLEFQNQIDCHSFGKRGVRP